MVDMRENGVYKLLVGYYRILQSMHLCFLARAGFILYTQGRVPFPASPPPGGWVSEVLPFLMGMAAADVIAICLGIYFVYSFLKSGQLNYLAGIISLTIAISSGVVYLIGTLPTGAWITNPISYLIVILAFSPIIPLYFLLARRAAGLSE